LVKKAPDYAAKAIELAKKIVRSQAGHTCEKCRMHRPLQGSHVFSVGAHHDMGAMLENIIALCNDCHMNWWHRKPAEALSWFERAYPERFERLSIRSQTTEKMDWQEVYNDLRKVDLLAF